jgi:hypothetical protein
MNAVLLVSPEKWKVSNGESRGSPVQRLPTLVAGRHTPAEWHQAVVVPCGQQVGTGLNGFYGHRNLVTLSGT